MSRPTTAVVTGASRGIGLALARRLLDEHRVDRVYAASRAPEDGAALAALRERHGQALRPLALDVTDPVSIEAAATRVGSESTQIDLLLSCAGVLHDDDGLRPEKRVEQVEVESLQRAFAVNAFGPLLVARAFLGLLAHEERSVIANLSARVGSIEDNRLGGWYGYRASKAAQNMFTRTLAIELQRRAPRCICVALHPGTVDTALSRPFQRGVPAGRLFEPERAARQLLDVIDGLSTEDSGRFFAWDGTRIPW